MSTQFFSKQTGEWVGTRWFGGQERGCCFDFGANPDRAFDVKESCDRGETFENERGEQFTGEQMWRETESRTWTFGEFGGTFEVGSGDMSTFEGS